MRPGEILRLHRDLATGQGALPLRDRCLPPGDLVFGDAAHVLRRMASGPTRRGKSEEESEKWGRGVVLMGVTTDGEKFEADLMRRYGLTGADLDLLVRLLHVDDDGFVGLDV